MASSKEPSEAEIQGFTAIAGADVAPIRAIQFLKAYNHDLNNAINAFFENPDAMFDQQSQVSYDENQFHTDRADSVQVQNQAAFTIHPSDTLKPNVYADNAPSRPPSRASTQVLTTSNGVGATESPNMANQEEDDLSRAMAMSLNDGRNLAGQETGTIEHSKSTLAPANREHYDPAQWAMTYAGSHTQEILLNPEPTNRKRSKNTPAFFKPSSTGHRLPALIKILHAVPMAREALLNRNQTLPEYGYEKEWWNGTTIKVLRNVNIGTEGRRVNEDNIIYETQRLMAFLDESDRAYGSTAVLANLEGNELRDGEMMSDFLTAWQTAAAHTGEPLANIFESIGIKRNLIHPETVVSSASRRFDLSITHELYGRGLTLYEAVDNLLWGDANEDEEVFCEKLGDVVVFEVNNGTSNGSGLGIDIPATWYADRYLSSFRSQAKDMLARKAAIEYEMRKEEEKQSSITEFHQSVSSARLDAAQLLSKSTAYFEQTVSYQGAIKGISGSGEKSFGDKHQNLAIPHLIAEELKALTDRISQKLKAFEEVRNSAQGKLREISQLYTKSSDDPKQPPYHKYTLRGISTSENSVFVLESAKPDEEDDILTTEAKDWQWWKLEYLSNETKPVICTQMFEADVLKAASTDSRNALLVYANEKAVSYPSGDLPSQLQNFVRADNLSFSAELEGSANPTPATPTKRKADNDHNNDTGVEHRRSPPHDRNIDKPIFKDDLDPSPPDYDTEATCEAIIASSYDDLIPRSLRGTRGGIDSAAILLDQEVSDHGQEMKERSGEGLLRRQRIEDNSKYSLGTYTPKIIMDDDRGDEDSGDSRQF